MKKFLVGLLVLVALAFTSPALANHGGCYTQEQMIEAGKKQAEEAKVGAKGYIWVKMNGDKIDYTTLIVVFSDQKDRVYVSLWSEDTPCALPAPGTASVIKIFPMNELAKQRIEEGTLVYEVAVPNGRES